MAININVYDAHLHFPIKADNAYDAFKREVIGASLNGCMLILNTPLEKSLFWDKLDNLCDEDLGFIPHIAYLIDPKTNGWPDELSRLIHRGIKYAIKLHPRLSNITLNDFDSIKTVIETIDSNLIIVDDWIYGPQLENHIGTQLSIFLAEQFPQKKIVIAHAGGIDVLKTMLLTRPLKNVFYDLSNTFLYLNSTSVHMDIMHFIKWTSDRVMFGSDFPEFSIQSSIDFFRRELSERFDYNIVNNVMYENAVRLYSGLS